MRLGRQSVQGEVLPAGHDEALVLRINIADEEPSADAVVLERHFVLFEQLCIIREQGFRLSVAASLARRHSHRPEVLVTIVTNDGGAQAVGSGNDLRAALQVEPEGELAAVEGRLLNVGDGTRVVLSHEGSLIGGIREEVALEDGLCALHLLRIKQMRLCQSDASELFGECFASRLDVQHSVPLCCFPLWGKGRELDAGTDFFQVYFVELHGALYDIGCKGTAFNSKFKIQNSKLLESVE